MQENPFPSLFPSMLWIVTLNSLLTSCPVLYKSKPPLNKVFYCAWRVLKQEFWEYLSILFVSRAQNNGSRYRILKHDTKPKDVRWWCLDQIHCAIKLFGFQNPSSQASGTTHALFGVRYLTRQHGVRFPECEFLRLEPAVSVCGSFYWLMTNNQIFTFHEDTESWTIFVQEKLF